MVWFYLPSILSAHHCPFVSKDDSRLILPEWKKIIIMDSNNNRIITMLIIIPASTSHLMLLC